MRVGIMVKKMNEQSNEYSYTLVSLIDCYVAIMFYDLIYCFLKVLPPWGPLYHWQTREIGIQSRIPWKEFFDIKSISRYVKSIDFEDFLGEYKKSIESIAS